MFLPFWRVGSRYRGFGTHTSVSHRAHTHSPALVAHRIHTVAKLSRPYPTHRRLAHTWLKSPSFANRAFRLPTNRSCRPREDAYTTDRHFPLLLFLPTLAALNGAPNSHALPLYLPCARSSAYPRAPSPIRLNNRQHKFLQEQQIRQFP